MRVIAQGLVDHASEQRHQRDIFGFPEPVCSSEALLGQEKRLLLYGVAMGCKKRWDAQILERHFSIRMEKKLKRRAHALGQWFYAAEAARAWRTLSNTRTYSRAEVFQEKSLDMPFRMSFCQAARLR